MIWEEGGLAAGRFESLVMLIPLALIVVACLLAARAGARRAGRDAALAERLTRSGAARERGPVVLRGHVWSDLPGNVVEAIPTSTPKPFERHGVLKDAFVSRRFWLRTTEGDVAIDAREGKVLLEYPGPPGFASGLRFEDLLVLAFDEKLAPGWKPRVKVPRVGVGDSVVVGGWLRRASLAEVAAVPDGLRDPPPAWIMVAPEGGRLVVSRRDVVAQGRHRVWMWRGALGMSTVSAAFYASALGAVISAYPSWLALTPTLERLAGVAALTVCLEVVAWLADQDTWWLRTLESDGAPAERAR